MCQEKMREEAGLDRRKKTYFQEIKVNINILPVILEGENRCNSILTL